MHTARWLSAAALMITLTGCGQQTGTTADMPGVQDAAGGGATEPATARGLAAAVLAHLDDADVTGIRGGLTDMEDQRAMEVTLALPDGLLLVSAADPSYLPGDRGLEACKKEGPVKSRWGTSECTTLADGTVVQLITTPGFSDDNSHGSGSMVLVNGPGRELQIFYESYRRTPVVAPGELRAIAVDPLVGWRTSAGLNHDGEDIVGFRQHDEVQRSGASGDSGTPDVQPAE